MFVKDIILNNENIFNDFVNSHYADEIQEKTKENINLYLSTQFSENEIWQALYDLGYATVVAYIGIRAVVCDCDTAWNICEIYKDIFNRLSPEDAIDFVNYTSELGLIK